MARTTTTARSQPRRESRPGPPKTAPARLPLRVLRWLLTFARPRSSTEVLTLLLVLLGFATVGTLATADAVHHRFPGLEILSASLFWVVAAANRLAPWWRPYVREMTADRLRSYGGTGLLLFVALDLSLHLLSSSLGLGRAYALLGAASEPPWAFGVLVTITLIAFAMLLRLPIGTWLSDGTRSALASMAAARERRVLRSADVEPFTPEYGDFEAASLLAFDDEPIRPLNPRIAKHKQIIESLVPPVSSPELSPLPPIETFAPPAKKQAPPLDLDQVAQRITDTLASFNVRARVVGYHHGPTVTQFDVKPDEGVKVKSITSLQNDLALALAAPTIRIQAPVPGKPVVGIEIPNSAATMVSLRELLESEAYQRVKSPLGVVLGKDVAGAPAVIDLARMPHLLIAGATGSGKSVCVNALISCLLYRNSPEDVRLMMIDPKMVELTVYNGVPHLLSPVVTEMDKVVGVLQWVMREMERRYRIFADTTVRNIARYNEKMLEAGQTKLPYIVLIIDELADLMMVAPEDVEDAVCRLAQLARAAGIHLVIATQRPSVDVITGLIKANFPARIAFAMTSQVDSRTILDSAGAEKLLGRGDMLYQPPDAPKPVRLQGAFLSDQEIERLVEFWQRSPLQQAVQRIQAQEFEAAEKAAAVAGDELLGEAIGIIREFQTASVSLLQRKLRIGYSRAARLMDQLEERGIVGVPDGSKQRAVLIAEDFPRDGAESGD